MLAVACATTVTCVWLLRPRERVEVMHERAYVTVPVPIAIEQDVAIPAERARCPLPRTDAPLAKPTQLPEKVDSVQPSPTNAGWIAAWNATRIFVSRDAGATWTRVLDGRGAVHDVAFDCFGRVIAVRGTRVGIQDTGATWRSVPLRLDDAEDSRRSVKVFGGGPDIAIGGYAINDTMTARLAISHDGGSTWRTRTLVTYWEGDPITGRQHEDGSIDGIVPLADCDSYSQVEFRYHDGKLDLLDEKPRDFGRFAPEADAAGYVWNASCGKLTKARATRGSDPRGESTGEADEAGCDPS